MHRSRPASKPEGCFASPKPVASVVIGRQFNGRRLSCKSVFRQRHHACRPRHVVIRALFGFGRKKKKSQPAEIEDATITAGEMSDLKQQERSSEKETGISVDPSPWHSARSIGGLAMKGLVFGVAVFGLYSFVKDFMQLDEKNKSDFRQILREVNRIRNTRGKDPMSAKEENVLIERCTELLLSLEQKSPEAAVRLAVSMLGMDEVTDAEKQGLVGAFHDFAPVPKLSKPGAIPGRMIRETKGEPGSLEPTSEPKGAVPLPENEAKGMHSDGGNDFDWSGEDGGVPPWWSGLPYVCVLVAKSCNAMLMLSKESGENSSKFCIVAFEDPQEAQVAKQCLAHDPFLKLNPFRQSRSKTLEELGIRPADMKHWKAKVDATWLSPKELDGILCRTKSEGMVVPAGTLRGVGEKFTDARELVRLIREACRSEGSTDGSVNSAGKLDGDVVEAVPVDLPTTKDEPSSNSDAVNKSDIQSDPSPPSKSYIDGSFLSGDPIDISAFDIPKPDLDGSLPHTPVSKAEERSKMEDGVLPRFVNTGANGGGKRPGASMSNGTNGTPVGSVGEFDDPSLGRFGTSINVGGSEASTSLDDVGSSNGSAHQQAPRERMPGDLPWWAYLKEVHIPRVKKPGKQGGAVEVNFAVIPDYTDYRLVLFEDKADAQQFLGVFGTMVGEDAMVGVSTMEPRRFLATMSKSKLKSIVVLGKGTMMVTREMDYQQVVGSIRFATQCTAREHGEVVEQNIPDEMMEEAGFGDIDVDGSMKGAAEDMIAELESMLKQGGWDGGDESNGGKDEDSDAAFTSFLDDTIQESLQNADPKTGDAMTLKDELNEQDLPFTRDASSNGVDSGRGAREPSSRKSNDNAETKNASPSPSQSEPEKAGEGNAVDSDPRSTVNPEAKQANGVEEEVGDEDDGIEVIYPNDWKKEGENVRKGPRWYLALPVVYLPQYVDESGEATFLAFPIGKEKTPIVLGFQHPGDAEKCAEVMSEWEQNEGKMTGVCPMSPQVLMKQCQSEFAGMEPVILRKESLPLMPGMKVEELVAVVELFHQLQNGDFSSLQQK